MIPSHCKYIIIGNFGNHSLAAMQALIEKGLTAIHFIYVKTGWAAAAWEERVARCSHYAKQEGVTVHCLEAKLDFAGMVRERRQFPNQKFQWCASFLKGLPILAELDEIDPTGEALVVLGKRRSDSRRYVNLQEFDEEEELYQGRRVWHPLWQTDNQLFVNLIKRAGFTHLPHQSLECHPCIHANEASLQQMDEAAIRRVEVLEEDLQQTLFPKPIRQACSFAKAIATDKGYSLEQFDLGCGAAWGCGE